MLVRAPSGRQQGAKGSGPALTPTAALLKSIIINSAEPLQGLVNRNAQGDWRAVGGVPSFRQGHGIVRMSTVLPLKDSANTTDLWFADEGPGLQGDYQAQHHCVHFPYDDGRTFKVRTCCAHCPMNLRV